MDIGIVIVIMKMKKNVNNAQFPQFFFDFENDIDKYMFNISFFKFYHSRLCHELSQLFDEDQSTIECFSSPRIWILGEKLDIWGNLECLSLSESIRYREKPKIAKLKAEKLPIPAEFLPVPDEPNFEFF